MVSGNTFTTANLTGRRLRKALMAGAAIGLPMTGGLAAAQEVTIDDERTTPIETATANGGGAADIVITEDGSIVIDQGTALTVNSDNDVDQDGEIVIGHTDDAIGVLLEPGFAGNYTLSGDIILDRTDEQEDQNLDEIFTDYADNRRGLQLGAGGTFTGDITLQSASEITIFGDDSIAVDLAGTLDGDLIGSGSVTAVGENAIGYAISDTLTGDFITGANSTAAIGNGARGVFIDGDINGAFVHRGSIFASGYLDTTPDAEDAENNNNDEQAASQATAAIDITGNVGGGILLQGALPADERPEDYVAPSESTVGIDGGGPAIWIHGGATIGEVDTSEQSDAYGDWGFINRGIVQARGVYSGIDSTAILVEDATIFGGIRNDNSIRASALNASTTAVEIGAGTSLDDFYNGDSIETVISQNDTTGGNVDSIAVHIASGASLPTLTNNFRIQANATGDDADAIGILDESGTLTEITNAGGILASLVDFTDEDITAPVGTQTAIDLSANTTGVTVTNTVSDDFDPATDNRANFGLIRGDVILGSGDDTYTADAGSTQGNLFFGAGSDTVSFSMGAGLAGNATFGTGNDMFSIDDGTVLGNFDFGDGMDTLAITNGSFFSGDVDDSDGMLDIVVDGGSIFYETGADVTTISNLTLGSASTLGVGISQNGEDITNFIVSDTATLADGATIQPVFLGGSIETISGEFITAGTLNVNPDQLVVGDEEGNTPFLFNIDFESVDNGDGTSSLLLNVQRRTAEELGLQEGLAPAYVPTLEALGEDEDLGPLVLNFTEEADFRDALGQLLAGPLDAPIAYARAQNNSVTSIITQRLDLARNTGSYPRTFWIQEETYFLNRDSDEVSNGFDGGGFSLAAGVDAGLDNFVDAVGISASISSAKYDEQKGGDFPFSRLTYGLGAYAAFSSGPISLDTRAEYAISESDSERNINISGVQRNVRGEWEGTQLSANARLRYSTEVMGLTTEPFISADYITIDEDAYEEEGGDGINLAVSDRTYESLRANLGVRLGKVFELQPSAYDTGIPGTLHPQFTLAWSQELIDDPLEAEYRYLSGGDSFTLFADPEDGAAIIGADIAYENEYAKVHLGVSGTFGETTEAIILRAGVGLKW